MPKGRRGKLTEPSFWAEFEIEKINTPMTTTGNRLFDICRGKGLGRGFVAERLWPLASYEVAGKLPHRVFSPGGTADFPVPTANKSPAARLHPVRDART